MSAQRLQNEQEIIAIHQRLVAGGPDAARSLVTAKFQAWKADAVQLQKADAFADLAHGLATKLSQAEFVALVRDGITPDAVSLTPRQLETMRGGWPSGGCWGGPGNVGIGDAIWGSVGYLF